MSLPRTKRRRPVCNLVIGFACLFGVATAATAAPPAQAHSSAQALHAHWIILLTVTDRSSGAQVEKKELAPDLQFVNATECRSIVAKAGPIPASEHFSAVLTCRKAGLATAEVSPVGRGVAESTTAIASTSVR
jgi:hypothetical protein